MSGKFSVSHYPVLALQTLLDRLITNPPYLAHTGVGEADWAFKTSFEIEEHVFSGKHADLVLEGLDTYAIVTLVWLVHSYNRVLG